MVYLFYLVSGALYFFCACALDLMATRRIQNHFYGKFEVCCYISDNLSKVFMKALC